MRRGRDAEQPEFDLAAWGARFGLALEPGQCLLLEQYERLLGHWARRINLVSRHDLGRLRVHHLADGLVAASRIPDGARVVDLGSGAGLPGLVVAIARPRAAVFLVEARRKRVTFLLEAARILRLGNVDVGEGRIEALAAGPPHRGSYDIATLRAVAPPDRALVLARPFVRAGGRVVLMCGPADNLAGSSAAPVDTFSYELPDGTPRRLLSIPVE